MSPRPKSESPIGRGRGRPLGRGRGSGAEGVAVGGLSSLENLRKCHIFVSRATGSSQRPSPLCNRFGIGNETGLPALKGYMAHGLPPWAVCHLAGKIFITVYINHPHIRFDNPDIWRFRQPDTLSSEDEDEVEDKVEDKVEEKELVIKCNITHSMSG